MNIPSQLSEAMSKADQIGLKLTTAKELYRLGFIEKAGIVLGELLPLIIDLDRTASAAYCATEEQRQAEWERDFRKMESQPFRFFDAVVAPVVSEASNVLQFKRENA